MNKYRIIMPVGTSLCQKQAFGLFQNKDLADPNIWRLWYRSAWQHSRDTDRDGFNELFAKLPNARPQNIDMNWPRVRAAFIDEYLRENRSQLSAELSSLSSINGQSLLPMHDEGAECAIELWASDTPQGVWIARLQQDIIQHLAQQVWNRFTTNVAVLRMPGVQPYDAFVFRDRGFDTIRRMTASVFQPIPPGTVHICFNLTGGLKVAIPPIMIEILQNHLCALRTETHQQSAEPVPCISVAYIHEDNGGIFIHDLLPSTAAGPAARSAQPRLLA